MYKTFTLPLKSVFFALSALFILTACGGFTLDLNLPPQTGDCIANPFESECGEEYASFRQLIIDDCANKPEKSDTSLCIAAEAATNPPSDDENGAEGAVAKVVDTTPKDTEVKSEFDKDSFTKTDKEKAENTGLEIVDLCSDPATADDKQCTPAVVDCINNPFSGSCQGDNVLGNFVRDDVTVSKTVVLQDKRAEDCRTGRIDRALCQTLNSEKQRCTGAAFTTDASCSAVAYSVCKADAFDPLCGEKEDLAGVYFSERSNVCYEDPNNPNCKGANGHVAVVCSEYPFDRLCTGNADYDDARANACEANPSVSSSCPTAPAVKPKEKGTGLEVTVNVCLNNPFDSTCVGVQYNIDRTTLITKCVLTQIVGRRTAQCDAIFDEARPCLINPFDSACDANPAIGTYIGLLRSTRVGFCNSNFRVASYCTGVPVATPQVTAKVWADSFTTPLATEATRDHLNNTESQFLIGRATDLDDGDVPPSIIRTSGNLNLADATFNGVALGGDRADGLAFLTDGALYAGILSGTSLGAPLTDTIGSAKWIGSFQLAGHSPTDFVLNVSFGTGNGAGEIEALIQRYVYFSDHYVTGEFDDAGVITGTVRRGIYRINDPANRRGTVTAHQNSGKLTGIIGEEGAVGAFIVDDYYSVGGFVARPSSVAELANLEQTCIDDPFNKLCNIGYESERNAVIEHCIIGGNASGASCDSANELHVCIKHPFRADCDDYLSQYYEQARANRLAFCRTVGNADDALCTVTETFAHICTNHPFDAQCLGNGDYDQARQNACDTAGAGSTECRTLAGLTCGTNPFSSYCGGGYNNARESACRNGSTNTQCGGIISGICGNNPFDTMCGSGYTLDRRTLCSDDPFTPRCAGNVYNDLRVSFCEDNAGTHPSCPAPEPTTPQVTAEVWADSFDEDLAHGVTAEDTKSQFLIGRETDLDTGGVRPWSTNPDYNKGLNLADATFNGVALGGDRADGVAFFAAGFNNSGAYGYAGILSGTNLGAPLTNTIGTAKWIGSFREEAYDAVDFVLNISFGTGAGVGEIEALIQKNYNRDYYIVGEFDDSGVITGTAWRGYSRSGKLTGIIGQEGAVGAFVTGKYFGGFVARPSSATELQTLAQTCGDNPFHEHCAIGHESQRHAIIEHCIIGGNANDESCDSANDWYPCIRDPFGIYCGHPPTGYSGYYEQAKINRLAFCRTAGNAGNALCTVEKTFAHICTNHPFDAQCLGNGDYNQARQDACDVAGAGSTECRTLAGLNCGTNPFSSYCGGEYNNARASACNANPGQSRCRDTVERVCNGNPFDTLCRNTTVYLSVRINICRGNPLDGRCGWTISTICNSNPFDTVCGNPGWNNAREIACRAGTATTGQCSTTVAGICSGNPFDSLCGSGYTQIRRNACSGDPFATRCLGEGYNDLRVTFCENNAGNPACPTTTPQVTAKVWVDSFDEPLSHAASADDTSDKFLIGKETDLDTGGLRPYSNDPNFNYGNLNLADATFNGVALGGDAADGVAFFAARADSYGFYYSYSGILSGTNLGAPLTDTEGSAKWIGSFRIEQRFATDFVLNISFGAGDEAGEIEALIQRYNFTYQDDYIIGKFNDAGVITGTVQSGRFRTNDPDNRGHVRTTGKLTGIIGEEGAVGAFLMDGLFGGFVARPTSAEELRTLEQTCTDDPFNRLCAVGYEAERTARIEHCIIGGNANDTARCGFVKEWLLCIHDPFKTLCNILMPKYYEQTRANRIAFCRNAGNADNALCTVETTFTHICTNHPFDALCRGDNDYRPIRRTACTDNPFATRCAGDTYNDLRVSFCTANAGNPACQSRPNVTAAVWVDSFDGNLRQTPDTSYSQIDQDPSTGQRTSRIDHYDARSSFLESNGDSLDTGTLSDSWYEQRDIEMEILNFDTATFDGKYLNGDAEDGLVFFTGVRLKTEGVINARYHSHAGIISTTDLGAPLNQTGSATWHGTIVHGSLYDDDTDFSLDIVFNGVEGGTLSAFISQNARSWFLNERNYHVKLAGAFDANGVITGTLDEGIFIDSDPNKPKQPRHGDSPRELEVLSGLIGEEGAIGAFQGGGGFVVRPSEAFMSQAPLVNNARVTTADWLESFEVALSGAPAYRNAPTPYDIFGEDNPYRYGVNDPNEFLKGAKTGMSLRNGPGVTYNVLTLADSTLDGQSLGGDASDGLAITRNRYLGSHYASILSGTDLGAPLTQNQGTVNWYGTFRVFGWHHVNRDFELRINFGAGDSAGTLNAFVRSQHVNTYHYRINGVFDDNGVITGAVELGNFGGQDAALPTHGRKSGELRGLIGEEGAIAVFISDENNFNGFSGGFVATPDLTHVVSAAPVADTSPNRVTTSDWLESFDVTPSPTLDGNLNTRFLGKEEVSTGSRLQWYGAGNRGYEWITFAPVVRSGKSEAKNIRQGAFSTSSKDGKYVYFAGILPNTDLGAPLISSDVPVYWNGTFQATLPYEIKETLVLKVSFNGGANHVGEVEAFVKDSGDLYYYLKGNFDDKGVIKGTVKYGDISDRNNNPSRNGVLTGLIGEEGAAGAFVANINNGFGDYSGGFIARSNSVASPTATPTPVVDTTPNRVTAADWLAGFDTMPRTVPNTDTYRYSRKNQFLRSTGGILNPGVIVTYSGGRHTAPDISNLTLADTAFGSNRGDAADGVAMFGGKFPGGFRYEYAGILSGTDLGAPVTQTTGTAEWEGRFQTTRMDAKDFTLEIDFGNREVEAFVHRSTDYYYYMTGTFDRNGLIKGAVDSGNFANGNRETPRYHGSLRPAEMRGLIGQEGAVGVFISDTNYSGYAGGFVARPPSE